MEKRKYEKETVWLNLKDDLDLSADINVAFWKDPSKHYIFELMRTTQIDIDTLSFDEIQQLNKDYFAVASAILIDCDIEGIDFSTPITTEEAFVAKELPWGIFHEALLAYFSYLTDTYQVLKNVLRRVRGLSDSGTNKQQAENE